MISVRSNFISALNTAYSIIRPLNVLTARRFCPLSHTTGPRTA